MPTAIYHYTNIEILALILKNRTLRFNRLDKVDDPEESIFISNGIVVYIIDYFAIFILDYFVKYAENYIFAVNF